MKSDESVIKVYSPIAKAWASFRPPARPSQEELEFYEQCILKASNKKDSKVLILGVTPELRDICTKHKLDVTLVDISQDMVNAMNEVVKEKNPKEKLVIANWLDMKFNEKFDLIMGDIVITLFALEDWNQFLTKIKSLLNKNGYFITRVMLDSPLRKETSMANMIEQYKQGVLLNKGLDRTAVFFSDSDIRNPKTCKIDYMIFNEKLKKFLEKGTINQMEYDALKLQITNIPVIVPAQDYFEKSLKGNFKIKEKFIGKGFVFSKYFPTYFLSS